MKKFIFLIIILIVTWSTNAQQTELQILVNQKQYIEVLAYTKHLSVSDSANLQTMYAIGQAYEGLLKYNDAYRYYLHCLSLDTTRIELLNTIARTAAYIGKLNDSEMFFRKVLLQDSTDFYANYQLGRLYMQTGRNQKAIDQFLFLLDKDPANPVLLRSIGDGYNRMDNLPNAISYYQQAFELNKENASLATTLSNMLLLIQQTYDALTICDTALLYNPSDQSLLQTKGIILFTQKEYALADEIYTQLMQEGDSTYKTLKYGAVSKYYAGKYMDAIEPLELAYAKDTTSVEVCLLLGSALGRTYNRKRAYELFDYAEELMQPAPLLINMLNQFKAETFARDGQFNKASALYYELWNNSQKTTYLDQIWQLYMISDLSKTTDEERRQRSLFINTLIANEYLRENKGKTIQYHVRKQLEQFHEDMFFRGIKEQTMLAPNNKKSKITLDKLNELIQRLPEKMPEDDENMET